MLKGLPTSLRLHLGKNCLQAFYIIYTCIWICSLFMSSALPRPASNDCIILFVIGGITSAEVRQIREMVAKHNLNNKQVRIL